MSSSGEQTFWKYFDNNLRFVSQILWVIFVFFKIKTNYKFTKNFFEDKMMAWFMPPSVYSVVSLDFYLDAISLNRIVMVQLVPLQ